jgi:hypothetical protein
MREIRLLRGRLPRKGGGLTGMQFKLNLSAWSVRFVANCFLVQILKQNKNQNIFRLSPSMVMMAFIVYDFHICYKCFVTGIVNSLHSKNTKSYWSLVKRLIDEQNRKWLDRFIDIRLLKINNSIFNIFSLLSVSVVTQDSTDRTLEKTRVTRDAITVFTG